MDSALEMQLLQSAQGIERHLDRIATVLEAREMRESAEHATDVHLDRYPPEVQELISRLMIPGVRVRAPEPPEPDH